MRLTICLTAVIALCASSTALTAKPADAQINSTSWTYAEKDGTKIQMSVDADGNYIENTAAGKHHDHGTAMLKGDKVCFTSAMNKDGESCWTNKAVKVGQSMVTKSDKGETLKVTRVAYTPLSMPK
jgi:hypothetical protein